MFIFYFGYHEIQENKHCRITDSSITTSAAFSTTELVVLTLLENKIVNITSDCDEQSDENNEIVI